MAKVSHDGPSKNTRGTPTIANEIGDSWRFAPTVIETLKRRRSELTPDEAVDDDPNIALEIADKRPTTDNAP